jgi:hypothetical protein
MSLDLCPYCADPAAFGLLPAREVEIDTTSRLIRLDYGSRRRVSSLVHPEKNEARLMAGIRCYNDTNAQARIAEDAKKAKQAVEEAAVA